METSYQIFEYIYEQGLQERIDKFLALENEAGWTRSQIQKWLREGHVQVNGQSVKANYKLKADDHVLLKVSAQEEIIPESMHLDIAYEDQDLLIINKPRGMVVHPAAGHQTGTLVNGLLAYTQDLSDINGILRPGIVHRIDKDTSGLLMVAKNNQAHLSLASQLEEHKVTRCYLGIVHGELAHDEGSIDAPIGRHPRERKIMGIVSSGKKALTHFKVVERFLGFTLVQCQLETGRTHQIRVHLKYIGHPLAGDPLYGPRKSLEMAGQALHAHLLKFVHPSTGMEMHFESKLPEDMLQVIEKLRKLG